MIHSKMFLLHEYILDLYFIISIIIIIICIIKIEDITYVSCMYFNKV